MVAWRDWQSNTQMVNWWSQTTTKSRWTIPKSPTKYKRRVGIGSWSARALEKSYRGSTWNLLSLVLTSSCKWKYNKMIWCVWQRWQEVLLSHCVLHILVLILLELVMLINLTQKITLWFLLNMLSNFQMWLLRKDIVVYSLSSTTSCLSHHSTGWSSVLLTIQTNKYSWLFGTSTASIRRSQSFWNPSLSTSLVKSLPQQPRLCLIQSRRISKMPSMISFCLSRNLELLFWEAHQRSNNQK